VVFEVHEAASWAEVVNSALALCWSPGADDGQVLEDRVQIRGTDGVAIVARQVAGGAGVGKLCADVAISHKSTVALLLGHFRFSLRLVDVSCEGKCAEAYATMNETNVYGLGRLRCTLMKPMRKLRKMRASWDRT
jgi:hypothetical protein